MPIEEITTVKITSKNRKSVETVLDHITAHFRTVSHSPIKYGETSGDFYAFADLLVEGDC